MKEILQPSASSRKNLYILVLVLSLAITLWSFVTSRCSRAGILSENSYTHMSSWQRNSTRQPKKLIYLNGNFDALTHRKDYLVSNSEALCGGLKCTLDVTDDADPRDSDLALFFVPTLVAQQSPPTRIISDQLWMFFSLEAQIHMRGVMHPDLWNGVFNYSTTFLQSSPVQKFSFFYKKNFRPKATPTAISFAKERRLKVKNPSSSANALWFVSHCNPPTSVTVHSGRNEFGLELSKYIKIDAFTRSSRCNSTLGKLLRNRTDGVGPNYNDYWFYLAFENNLCKDYITEKLWKILTQDTFAIPVVIGAIEVSDYEDVAPPNSFIHVKNFSSVQALAEHLHYITSNDEAFNYYHEWRNRYEFYESVTNEYKPERFFCYVCELAHTRPPGVVQEFSQEFKCTDCISLDTKERACQYYNLPCT